MKLVSAKEMILSAKKGKYAIGAFNINNLEWIKSVLLASQECNSPVILETSESAVKYMGGYKTVVSMVNNMVDYYNITVPVCLHLDHGTYEGAIKALEAGYTSIMFDGSKFNIEENMSKTKEIVELAKKTNASVEAEVGGIGGEEDGTHATGELASPLECQMISNLGIDMLAAGIGNIHGKYPENWKGLNFNVLSEIETFCKDVPLVLHGGSGIPTEMVKKAIGYGVTKVNVNTELQIAFAHGTRQYIESKKDLEGKGFDPRKLLEPGCNMIKEVVKQKIEMFGSLNKA